MLSESNSNNEIYGLSRFPERLKQSVVSLMLVATLGGSVMEPALAGLGSNLSNVALAEEEIPTCEIRDVFGRTAYWEFLTPAISNFGKQTAEIYVENNGFQHYFERGSIDFDGEDGEMKAVEGYFEQLPNGVSKVTLTSQEPLPIQTEQINNGQKPYVDALIRLYTAQGCTEIIIPRPVITDPVPVETTDSSLTCYEAHGNTHCNYNSEKSLSSNYLKNNGDVLGAIWGAVDSNRKPIIVPTTLLLSQNQDPTHMIFTGKLPDETTVQVALKTLGGELFVFRTLNDAFVDNNQPTPIPTPTPPTQNQLYLPIVTVPKR